MISLCPADCAEHTKPLVEGAKSVEEVRFSTIRSRFLTFCTKDCIQGVWNKAPKGAG